MLRFIVQEGMEISAARACK